jgi:hypothetical protein
MVGKRRCSPDSAALHPGYAVEVEVEVAVEVAFDVAVAVRIPHGHSRKSGREIGSRTRYV